MRPSHFINKDISYFIDIDINRRKYKEKKNRHIGMAINFENCFSSVDNNASICSRLYVCVAQMTAKWTSNFKNSKPIWLAKTKRKAWKKKRFSHLWNSISSKISENHSTRIVMQTIYFSFILGELSSDAPMKRTLSINFRRKQKKNNNSNNIKTAHSHTRVHTNYGFFVALIII